MKPVPALLADEAGQGLAEYALILGLIAVLCLVAIVGISTNIQNTLHKLSTAI